MKAFLFLLLASVVFAASYEGCEDEKPELFCKGMPEGTKGKAFFFAVNMAENKACFGYRKGSKKVEFEAYATEDYSTHPALKTMVLNDGPRQDWPLFQLEFFPKARNFYLQVRLNSEFGPPANWVDFYNERDPEQTIYRWRCSEEFAD